MHKQRGIMFDTETFGITPGSIILSIGAVEFTHDTILETYHVRIDPLDSERNGLHCDASTVMWWLKQSKEAQNALTSQPLKTLADALTELNARFKWEGALVWCNGAAFDFPLLRAAYKAAGVVVPWAYYNEVDMRTVKLLAGKAAWKTHQVEPTLKHDALADAIAQAKSVQNWQK